METGAQKTPFLVWTGVIFLQIVMTQIVTLLASFLLPNMENFLRNYAVLFATFLGITFSTGVFLAGWLSLKRKWIRQEPRYLARWIAALVGAYLPLVIALAIYHILEPGNPFFLVSILSSILGFYLPGWRAKMARGGS